MNFPLEPTGAFSASTGLLMAFIIGFGFGFFLEKAGFSSARNLAAQFYLRDFAVLKVMFTAIVVAGLGFWSLVNLGLLDLSFTFINLTYLWPQIVGGLILGVGFIVGGTLLDARQQRAESLETKAASHSSLSSEVTVGQARHDPSNHCHPAICGGAD